MARVEQRGLPAVKVHTNPTDCRYLSGKRAVNSVLVPWGDTRPPLERCFALAQHHLSDASYGREFRGKACLGSLFRR